MNFLVTVCGYSLVLAAAALLVVDRAQSGEWGWFALTTVVAVAFAVGLVRRIGRQQRAVRRRRELLADLDRQRRAQR